jgi:hypothetical protein
MAPEEVSFESGVFLLLKSKGGSLKSVPKSVSTAGTETFSKPEYGVEPPFKSDPEPEPEPSPVAPTRAFRVSGELPPELWNRLGTKILQAPQRFGSKDRG